VNLPGSRFIGFLQNHDQIGNRAQGERSSMLMSLDRLKIGAALVLCAPFVPLLFQGEELGATTPFLYFANHPDTELARAVSEGRRKDFAPWGWKGGDIPDPEDPAVFLRSKLPCIDEGNCNDADNKSQSSLIEWHQRLIALRRAEPDLTDARLDRIDVLFSEEHRWLAFRRGVITVVCNLFPREQKITLPSIGAVLLASSPECRVEHLAIELPSDSVVILKGGV
jgi:maltooligosyltrehalose trehalohydrolase